MDDHDTISRRIIDQAVDLFSKDPDAVEETPIRGELFTTAHYGQAMKAEFRMSDVILDDEICAKHLLHMSDIVKRVDDHLWQRKAQQEGLTQGDITETQTVPLPYSDVRLDVELMEIESKVMDDVLRLLADGTGYLFPVGRDGVAWWTIETMAEALKKNNNLVGMTFLENMVGLAFYTMAVDGRVVTQPNTLVGGARVTVFALAPKGADVDR